MVRDTLALVVGMCFEIVVFMLSIVGTHSANIATVLTMTFGCVFSLTYVAGTSWLD